MTLRVNESRLFSVSREAARSTGMAFSHEAGKSADNAWYPHNIRRRVTYQRAAILGCEDTASCEYPRQLLVTGTRIGDAERERVPLTREK